MKTTVRSKVTWRGEVYLWLMRYRLRPLAGLWLDYLVARSRRHPGGAA